MIEMEVLLGPHYDKTKSTKGAIYSYSHILNYFAAIRLRKAGFTFEQIAPLIRKYDEKELLRIATTGKIESSGTSKETSIKSVSSDKQIYEILKSLDRVEGRPLHSEQILIAITPWFHVHISKRQMHRLGPIEIDAVTEALRDTLLKKTKSDTIYHES